MNSMGNVTITDIVPGRSPGPGAVDFAAEMLVKAAFDALGSAATGQAGVDVIKHVGDAVRAVRNGLVQPPKPVAIGLGTNIDGIRDWSPSWAFSDIFKSSRSWISGTPIAWDDGRAVDTDADGWVRSLQPGQIARTLMLWDHDGRFPTGTYIVRWSGTGQLQFWGGCRVITQTQSYAELDVTGPAGIGIFITQADPADYIRGIQVTGPEGSLLEHGSMGFTRGLLESLRPYSVLRFMDWMETNNSMQSLWVDRPQHNEARFSTPRGVPITTIIDLANITGADPWLCIPHLASDDYIVQMASIVNQRLSPDRRVYLEWSNEVWNPMFRQHAHARSEGRRLNLDSNDFGAALAYQARRSVETFSLWSSRFDPTRMVRVISSQVVNTWIGNTLLQRVAQYGGSVDAIAVAPYFGYSFGDEDQLERVTALTPDQLIDEILSDELPKVEDWLHAYRTVADAANVKLIAYEGGQHLVGNGAAVNDARLNALYDAVNAHPRMADAYAAYMERWNRHGGLYCHFVDVSRWTKHGRWGLADRLGVDSPKRSALLLYK